MNTWRLPPPDSVDRAGGAAVRGSRPKGGGRAQPFAPGVRVREAAERLRRGGRSSPADWGSSSADRRAPPPLAGGGIPTESHSAVGLWITATRVFKAFKPFNTF